MLILQGKINREVGSAEAEPKDGGVNIAKYARCEWKCLE